MAFACHSICSQLDLSMRFLWSVDFDTSVNLSLHRIYFFLLLQWTKRYFSAPSRLVLMNSNQSPQIQLISVLTLVSTSEMKSREMFLSDHPLSASHHPSNRTSDKPTGCELGSLPINPQRDIHSIVFFFMKTAGMKQVVRTSSEWSVRFSRNSNSHREFKRDWPFQHVLLRQRWASNSPYR